MIYYECLLAGFAVIGWAQRRIGTVGHVHVQTDRLLIGRHLETEGLLWREKIRLLGLQAGGEQEEGNEETSHDQASRVWPATDSVTHSRYSGSPSITGTATISGSS